MFIHRNNNHCGGDLSYNSPSENSPKQHIKYQQSRSIIKSIRDLKMVLNLKYQSSNYLKIKTTCFKLYLIDLD